MTAARPSGSGSSGSTERQAQRMAIGSPRSGAVEHALGDLFSALDVRINSGGPSSLSDHEVQTRIPSAGSAPRSSRSPGRTGRAHSLDG